MIGGEKTGCCLDPRCSHVHARVENADARRAHSITDGNFRRWRPERAPAVANLGALVRANPIELRTDREVSDQTSFVDDVPQLIKHLRDWNNFGIWVWFGR